MPRQPRSPGAVSRATSRICAISSRISSRDVRSRASTPIAAPTLRFSAIQRGLSGRKNIDTNTNEAGIAAIATIARHDHTPTSVTPTVLANRMPIPIATLNIVTMLPRRAAGASSEMYIGTTWVAPPTARPRNTRAAISSSTPGASAQAIAPTVNSAVTIITVRRRPSRWVNRPEPIAPTTAPSRMADATSSCAVWPRWNSFVISSSAPEMMPVS